MHDSKYSPINGLEHVRCACLRYCGLCVLARLGRPIIMVAPCCSWTEGLSRILDLHWHSITGAGDVANTQGARQQDQHVSQEKMGHPSLTQTGLLSDPILLGD